MARVGARFQAKLDRRVFDAVVRKSAVAPDENSATGLRDLEAIQRLITSPVLMAFFDLPWTPVFFGRDRFISPMARPFGACWRFFAYFYYIPEPNANP